MDPVERAVLELQEQNYGSAIRTLEMLTGRDPSNAEAWKHLAQAYFKTGEKEKAAEAAQRYVALRPTDPAGHYNAGVILLQLGQTAAAERCFRAALSADPGYAKATEALGKMATSSATTAEAAPPAEPSAAVPSFSQPSAAAAPAAAVPAGPAKRGKMPWQAKVAAGGTVVASIAILLWLFLPGGPANPGPKKTAPQPTPNAITTPPANQPNAEQPNNSQLPQPTPNPQTQPNQSSTPAPTPSPSTKAPGASTQAQPIFSPQQAQAVAEQMDAAERQQLEGQLRALADWLRKDPNYQGRDGQENWEAMQAMIATSGMSMVPGGMSMGTGEVMALITNAKTNIEAANNIERFSANLKAALPFNVKQQIVQALGAATTANEAYSGTQKVLQASNTTLSQQTLMVLQQAAQQAEQAARGRMPTPGR